MSSGVLDRLDRDDATLVYEAIRLAEPGGLGTLREQDVAERRHAVTAGNAARRRPRPGRPAVRQRLSRSLRPRRAGTCERGWRETGLAGRAIIIACHLDWLAQYPDSLIARKRGAAEAPRSAGRRRRSSPVAGRTPKQARTPSSTRRLAPRAAATAAIPARRPTSSTACLFVASGGYDEVTGWIFTLGAAVNLTFHSRLPFPYELNATRSVSPRTTWSSARGTSSATKATSASACTATTTAPPSKSKAPGRNHYVFDFIALKHRTKAITDELDHRMMLPTRNPLIRRGGRAQERARPLSRSRMALSARGLRPAADREHHRRVAGPLHRRAAARRLKRQHHYVPEVLRVEVEENIGQSATCELRQK